MALLFAAAALPATALAQETVTPPTVLVPAQPAPAPQPVTPPPLQVPTAQTPPAGESRTTIAPGVIEQAEQEARERAAARQAEARQARPTRAVETPQRAAPVAAPAAAAPAAAPEAAPALPLPADPVAQTAPPVADPVTETAPAPVEAAPGDEGTTWLILAALGGVAALIAAAMLLRRRRADAPYIEDEVAVAAPVDPVREPIAERRMPDPLIERLDANPAAAAPAFIAPPHAPQPVKRTAPLAKPKADTARPAMENAALTDADPADIAAVLGGAKPAGGRPQLELAMRPIRAGMSRRGATVGFELTVANAGGAPAKDVQIGAFMLGETAAQHSEIERMLINPPKDSSLPAETIAPGDGTTLEAMLTMSRDAVDAIAGDEEGFTPVLVADARYRLPDGREGRTAAAFRIGRVNGGTHLEPIAIQDDPSMYADIEAELVGVPAKV